MYDIGIEFADGRMDMIANLSATTKTKFLRSFENAQKKDGSKSFFTTRNDIDKTIYHLDAKFIRELKIFKRKPKN